MQDIKNTSAVELHRPHFTATLCCIGAFIIQIVLAILYFFGVGSFYGADTDVIYMLNVGLGFLNMGQAYYQGIIGLALAVIYFIFLVLMIVDLIRSIILLARHLSKSPGTVRERSQKAISIMSWQVMSTFFKSLVFIVCSGFVNPISLNGKATATIVLAIIVFFASNLLYGIYAKFTFKSIFFNTVYNILFIVLIRMLIINADSTAIYDIVNAFAAFFTKLDLVITFFGLATGAIHIVLMCFVLNAIHNAYTWIPMSFSNLRGSAIRIMIAIGISLFIPLAKFIVNDNVISISTVFGTIGSYLELLLPATAFLVFSFLHSEEIVYQPKKKKVVATAIASEVEEASEVETAQDAEAAPAENAETAAEEATEAAVEEAPAEEAVESDVEEAAEADAEETAEADAEETAQAPAEEAAEG